ncbi:MAG: DJ-1/PfpI family protein [Gammaproteobacteria bacterium]|nr:DJ-1/PfpI family protein [Gammaproteobacteria bacterium]
MTQVLVPLAEGFEELEAVTIIDLLRRASIHVTVAGLNAGPITASRKTVLVPDCTLDEALKYTYEMVVLPGGQPGATNLEKDPRIANLLNDMAGKHAYIAAICAAPKVLAVAGLLKGKNVTCYPGTLNTKQFPDINLKNYSVVVDNKIVTSRGPGTAMDFALQLIELLSGKEKRQQVESGLAR